METRDKFSLPPWEFKKELAKESMRADCEITMIHASTRMAIKELEDEKSDEFMDGFWTAYELLGQSHERVIAAAHDITFRLCDTPDERESLT